MVCPTEGNDNVFCLAFGAAMFVALLASLAGALACPRRNISKWSDFGCVLNLMEGQSEPLCKLPAGYHPSPHPKGDPEAMDGSLGAFPLGPNGWEVLRKRLQNTQ